MKNIRTGLVSLVGNGLIHGIMDLSTVSAALGSAYSSEATVDEVARLAFCYGLLAFGLQPLLGLLVDKFISPRPVTLMACSLVTLSFFLFSSPLLTVLCAGVGSALFHVGAGSIILRIAPSKASPPGIFSAPGILGLVGGILIGEQGYFPHWPFILLLSLSFLFLLFQDISLKSACSNYTVCNNISIWIILCLVLFSMAIRALYGLSGVTFWSYDPKLFMVMAFAVFLGKILGGILADRWGWRNITTVSLLISAPLVAYCKTDPILIFIGSFFFSLSYAVPVRLVTSLFFRKLATIFGICESTILLQHLGTHKIIADSHTTICLIVLSTILLYIVISFFFSHHKFFQNHISKM